MFGCMLRSAVIVALATTNALLSPCADCWSHPFHFTTAEMEFNSRTGRFEVSIRVLASDLENALTQAAHHQRQSEPSLLISEHADKTSVENPSTVSNKNLNSTKNNGESTPTSKQEILLKYLKSNFQIRAKIVSSTDDKITPDATDDAVAGVFHWVGQETEQSWVWLYFEMEPPDSPNGWSLSNRLFMEINEQQVNTCVIRAQSQRISVKTEATNSTVDLPRIFHK